MLVARAPLTGLEFVAHLLQLRISCTANSQHISKVCSKSRPSWYFVTVRCTTHSPYKWKQINRSNKILACDICWALDNTLRVIFIKAKNHNSAEHW